MLLRFDPFRAQNQVAARQTNGMPFDAYRLGDMFFALFDAPGIDPSSIELTVEHNVLTVRGERTNQWGDGVELIVNERPSGSFTRQLFLGESLAADLIVASSENGVLTVAIPVAEKVKPRKVEIGLGNGHNGHAAPLPADVSA